MYSTVKVSVLWTQLTWLRFLPAQDDQICFIHQHTENLSKKKRARSAFYKILINIQYMHMYVYTFT